MLIEDTDRIRRMLAQRIRAQRKFHAVKLVAVTGYGRNEDRRKSIDSGLGLHLVKPIDPIGLLKAITSLEYSTT